MCFQQIIRRLPFAVVLLGTTFLARPATAQQEVGNTPWHLVDIWWDLGEEHAFESYSIDVTVGDGIDPEVRLYISPIGLGKLSDVPFYGGLQTQIGRSITRAGETRQELGPGMIFSRWGERSLEAVRVAHEGVCQSSGNEGDYISVRKPIAWSPGTYTCRLSKMDTVTIDDEPHTWVGMFIHDHATQDEIYVGALRFPGDNLVLGRQVASFVEIYGARIPLEEIPQTTIRFHNLQINGEPVELRQATAHYPRGVPDVAHTEAVESGVEVRLGEPIEREQRSLRLF